MSGIEILIGDHQGVFIPQQFAEWVGWNNIEDYERKTLLVGPEPENEDYWECWSSVLERAEFKDKEGNTWRLWQDGDLFAYCEELMSDEEYENLFGEPRS
jgi:hypothetical protein